MSSYFGNDGDKPGAYFSNSLVARDEGFNDGRHVGYVKGRIAGREEGLQEGRRAGYEEGRKDGWAEAVELANRNMHEQMGYTRQHIADKQALQQQLEEQQRLIEHLSNRLAAKEREQASLAEINTRLLEVSTALAAAKAQVQDEVAQMDARLKARTQQHHATVWEYNRSTVLMNAARLTLEAMTSGAGASARQARELFARHYDEQVSGALAKGTLQLAPHEDAELARALPKTRQFIDDMVRPTRNCR